MFRGLGIRVVTGCVGRRVWAKENFKPCDYWRKLSVFVGSSALATGPKNEHGKSLFMGSYTTCSLSPHPEARNP